MSTLYLNGVAVSATTVEWQPLRLGQATIRGFTGRVGSTERRSFREYKCTSPMGQHASAERLRKVVEGEGHGWNFERTAASSRGVVATVVTGMGNLQVTGGRWGGYLELAGAVYRWQLAEANVVTDWSLLYWHSSSASVWGHRAVSVVGGVPTTYVDGVPGAYTLAEQAAFSTSTGQLDLGDLLGAAPGGTWGFDEVAWVPYAYTAPEVAKYYAAANTRQLPMLPNMWAESDAGGIFPSPGLVVRGVAQNSRFERPNYQAVEFTLMETL